MAKEPLVDPGCLCAISTSLSNSTHCWPAVRGLHIGLSFRLHFCLFLRLRISDVSSAWSSDRGFPEKDEGDSVPQVNKT